MEQTPVDAAVRAAAFANGLRRSIAASGARWTSWPGGEQCLGEVLAIIAYVEQRLRELPAEGAERAPAIALCVADLRAVLEWSQYQSASLATARAMLFARKTTSFVQRFGLFDTRGTSLEAIEESEESLIENIETKNGYMLAIAEQHPYLELPAPLVDLKRLERQPEKPPGKLDLIRQLTQKKPRPRP